jgi:hypothetical protein
VAPNKAWRQIAATKGAEMTKRIRLLWVGLAAAATTAAVFTTPAIVAGITLNTID